MKQNFSKWINITKNSTNPIAVFNPKSVHASLNHWNKMIPNVQPFYAVKSFSDSLMLDSIHSYKKEKTGFDAGFDVASSSELNQVLKYKNNPIIFSHPVKSESEILYAKSKGVEFLVVDSIEELEKIIRFYPEAKVIIRIKSSEKYSTIKFNCKFGADFEQVVNILSRKSSKHMIKGFSFHVGSKCGNMKAYTETLDDIINRYIPLCDYYGNELELIDLGGGFENYEDITSLAEISKEQINFLCNIRNLKCIAEPGRYLSKRSITLFTKIIGFKFVNGRYHVYLNDSIYNSFSGKAFDHQKFKPLLKPVFDPSNKNLVECTIWGNSCDGEDIIVDNCLIPKPKVNDVLIWRDMGAYSLSSSVNGFNGFKMADIYLEEETKIE